MTEKSYPNAQRQGAFYIITSLTYAFYLAIATRASRGRWGATWASAIYMLIVAAMVWILPLFKARPLLAPIYLQLDHMAPPVFPFLLVAPAIFIDLVHQRIGQRPTFWKDWTCAAALGATFLFVFILAQWNFSAFLLSDGAKNWFFAGGRQWPYFIETNEWRGRFWGKGGADWLNFGSAMIALGGAIFKARIGLAVGKWMSRVQR
jgi:hypothetical protein